MIPVACLILVLCVILLMVNFGVGPFAYSPWSRLHSKFILLPNALKNTLTLLALFAALCSSLIIIGLMP